MITLPTLPSMLHRTKRILKHRSVKFIALGVIVFLAVTPVVTYSYFAQDISDRERLMNRSETGIILRDRNGEIFYKFGDMNGSDEVKLDAVADNFEKAIIASEDREFYQHDGYSVRGIAAALYANIVNSDPTRYGGSTITQQLVKNKLLTADKSYLRKYQEVTLAMEIERQYTKDEILEMYINSVYFGEGAFGVADAAKAYFGKTPQDLTLAESSMLVGLLPAPSAYSPISGDEKLAEQQQEKVLSRMLEAGVIDAQTQRTVADEPLTYKPASLDVQSHAQHFAMMVLDELKAEYGEERIIRSGFDVTTTLDLKWQKSAEAIAKERVATFSEAGGRNTTIVAIDPKNGHVRSLVGSVDWNNTEFGKVNMAMQPRQPGSSFKPIFYAEAFEKRLITPASQIKDQPTTYGADYKPTNYDFKYRGMVTPRSALALSMNIPAVEIMQKLGPQEAAAAAQRMGLASVTEPEKYGLSLALGTAEVNLYDLTNTYAAFANKGEQFSHTTYTAIKDKYSNKVFTATAPTAKRVLSSESSFLVSSILSDTQARASAFGNSLTIPGRQVAAKTGTTNDNKDAWTVGYSPNLAVGVWVGNNENQPMTGLVGASSAGVIWKQVMTGMLADMPAQNFERPSNVMSMRVCLPQGTYEEVFIKGTELKESCVRPTPRQETERKEEKPEEQSKPEEKKEEKPERDTEEPEGERPTGGRGGNDGRGNDDSQPGEEPTDPIEPVKEESQEETEE